MAHGMESSKVTKTKLTNSEVINMTVLGLLQIATIYSETFQQFLAVRSLFGLFMGGVYGNA